MCLRHALESSLVKLRSRQAGVAGCMAGALASVVWKQAQRILALQQKRPRGRISRTSRLFPRNSRARFSASRSGPVGAEPVPVNVRCWQVESCA